MIVYYLEYQTTFVKPFGSLVHYHKAGLFIHLVSSLLFLVSSSNSLFISLYYVPIGFRGLLQIG